MAQDDAWNIVAEAWEHFRHRLFEQTRHVSEWLVNAVDPQPGQTILELAAGPGETGFLAAQRVGPEGRVISTDLDAAMVAAARRGAESWGLTNVECRTMDAQEIDLDDASVDGAMCRFGIMLMPEPERALAGVRRVLRPGGRFAYAVIGQPQDNPWISILGMALVQTGHGAPLEGGGPTPFSLADPAQNEALLTGAGFADVKVEELASRRFDRNFDEYWDMQSRLAGPMAAYLASLPEAQRQEVKDAAAALAEPYLTPEGIVLPSKVVAAVGTA